MKLHDVLQAHVMEHVAFIYRMRLRGLKVVFDMTRSVIESVLFVAKKETLFPTRDSLSVFQCNYGQASSA